MDFQHQARLFKLRYLSQMVAGHTSKWVTLIKTEILQGLRKGPNKNDLSTWTCEEFLLLQPKIKVSSKVVHSLLLSWKDIHDQLRFDPSRGRLQGNMTVLQLLYLTLQGADFQQDDYRALKVWAHTRGICCVGDLRQNNTWITPAAIATRIRSSRQVGHNVFDMVYSFLSTYLGTFNLLLHQSPGWYWNTSTGTQKGWSFTMSTWRTLLPESIFNFQQSKSALGLYLAAL
jgi:hypothetical protein